MSKQKCMLIYVQQKLNFEKCYTFKRNILSCLHDVSRSLRSTPCNDVIRIPRYGLVLCYQLSKYREQVSWSCYLVWIRPTIDILL